METWVTLDKTRTERNYCIWVSTREPALLHNGYFEGEGLEEAFCVRAWHRLTDLRLKPGQCIRLTGKIHFPVERAKP